jgi:hypothetical protein
LLGDHAALLEHQVSPARAGKATLAWGFNGLWLRGRSSPEKSSAEVLESVESGQHPAKRDGGDDRKSQDRAEAGKGT